MSKLGRRTFFGTVIALAPLLGVVHGRAQSAAPAPWSRLQPAAERDVLGGKPLVVLVYVPLCSNAQINCGASWAGQPSGLASNVYWGALYGARRFLERPESGWERVAEHKPERGPVLEELVFRRSVAGSSWNRPTGEPIEQIVVLRAVHGSHINTAVTEFWQAATQGAEVSFTDGKRRRTERVHVAGYAGHNRLMDGVRLPETSKVSEHALPSFVLACYSERYFSERLKQSGSHPLLMTRTYMAPEGYAIDAMLKALGDNLPVPDLRKRVVDAYAKWQRLRPAQADWIFAK